MQEKRTTEETKQGGVGRTNFISQHSNNEQENAEVNSSNDISEVDRQEGSMDHGAKGGNFDETTQTNEETERKK